MNMKKIKKVKTEIARLMERITDLEKAVKAGCESGMSYAYPRESGSVKRASMDLTRALADMRRVDS